MSADARRSRMMIGLGIALALVTAFGAGAMWNGNGSLEVKVEPSVKDPADDAVAAAEIGVIEAQRDFDRAMADLDSTYPSYTSRRDPEMQRGERHAIELNETICKEYGQNCELAKMARRQYEEKYGLR